VLSGKRIERAERGEPGEFDRMSDEELRQAVLDHAEQVQFSRSQEIKLLEASAHQERSNRSRLKD
jgi:hypothetical protein